ncbi:MAG: hypothetical protein ACREP7_14510 [Lysobacter sp.]
MSINGPGGPSGNSGSQNAQGAQTAQNDAQTQEKSVEAKVADVETEKKVSQFATREAVDYAQKAAEALAAKDYKTAESYAEAANSRKNDSQRAADRAADKAADVGNDPRATDDQKAAAMKAESLSTTAARVAASVVGRLNDAMTNAGLRANAEPAYDIDYAVNTATLNQLDGIAVAGTKGTYAEVALGKTPSQS